MGGDGGEPVGDDGGEPVDGDELVLGVAGVGFGSAATIESGDADATRQRPPIDATNNTIASTGTACCTSWRAR